MRKKRVRPCDSEGIKCSTYGIAGCSRCGHNPAVAAYRKMMMREIGLRQTYKGRMLIIPKGA